MAYGKSIELFLVNGSADSLITAELSNWNGKAIKIPRIEVASCNREDITQAGVYFLFCKEDDGSDSVYIGEAENVKERLVQHLRDYQAEKEKYYWTTAVVFIGRDLNKALIRYLENRFVEIARVCKRYTVLTKNTYKNTVMKESQIAVMEEFVDNVKTLISVLGYKVLEPLNKPVTFANDSRGKKNWEDLNLHLERTIKGLGKVEADGIRTSEGFVVLQGSRIAVEDDDTIPTVLKEQRRKVSIVEGVLQEDVLFSSPSYAAMFVIGKSANGLTSWKDEDGHSLKEIENSETREENK
ncbi:GIY-YIG nuclease family protein [Lachnospiraceae bacterium OM04-12BH]|nr:GIY-YIG nuclease family protein [Lachnospiraceae bacterium OM04-12BH]